VRNNSNNRRRQRTPWPSFFFFFFFFGVSNPRSCPGPAKVPHPSAWHHPPFRSPLTLCRRNHTHPCCRFVIMQNDISVGFSLWSNLLRVGVMFLMFFSSPCLMFTMPFDG
ncbi:hypothetical protein QBC32DRAFT_351170, partial [Pseudoneurospora amorphoporcata]